METPTTRQLLDSLRESGLLSAKQIAAAEAASTEAGDVATFADKLWAAGVLTKYQYAKIKSNRFDDILYGPYLILDKIGEGGMGKVFKAVETAKRRFVALKTIRPQLMSNKTVLKRYEREANATKSLNHPNVVSLYDAGEIGGRFCMAMEYVEGCDLSRMVKEYGHPPQRGMDDYQEVCEYIRQAALGLQAAHSLGFVHRDIKPSNMLVYGERALAGTANKATVKILDMGLVRQMLESEEVGRTELTRDGTVVGTPDYMAPEQAKNSSTVDHRADLYALGCTLYFMLRGQSPFPEGNPIDKLIRHQLDAPPDLRPLRPDVPEGVLQVMERLLKKRPDERYASAADVAAALAPYTPGGAGGHAAEPVRPAYAAFSLEPDPPAPATPPPPTPTPTRAAALSAVHAGSALGPPPKSGVAAPSGRTAPPTPRHVPATPVSGTVAATAARLTPVVTPLSTKRPPGVRVMPVAATGHVVDAETVGPISSASAPTTSSSRSATPVSTPKPKPHRRPPQKAAKPKSGGPNAVYLGIGGVFGVGLAVAAVVALRSGSNDTVAPPTGPTAPPPATAKTPVGGYPHLPSAGQMLPPGTVAAAVAYPRPLWKEAGSGHPLPAAAVRQLDLLAKRTRFDPRLFDRTCVSFTATPGQYVATGEGSVLTPEWAAETETLLKPSDAKTRPDGARILKLGTVRSGPLAAGYIPGKAYAVSNDGFMLNGLAGSLLRSNGAPRIAEAASPALVAAFPAPDRADLPLLTFAATGPWALPLPDKVTLDQSGIRLAVAEVRWTDQFDVTLTLTGKDEEGVVDFVNVELAAKLGERYPSLKPVVGKLASAKPGVRRSDSDVEYKLAASFTWDEAMAAMGPLVPDAKPD